MALRPTVLSFGFYLLAYFVGCTPASAEPTISGIGRAKDGDSLMVGQTEVRLFGVDAPEFDQRCTRNGQSWSCGSAAADQLMRLVTGKDVRCSSMEWTSMAGHLAAAHSEKPKVRPFNYADTVPASTS